MNAAVRLEPREMKFLQQLVGIVGIVGIVGTVADYPWLYYGY